MSAIIIIRNSHLSDSGMYTFRLSLFGGQKKEGSQKDKSILEIDESLVFGNCGNLVQVEIAFFLSLLKAL